MNRAAVSKHFRRAKLTVPSRLKLQTLCVQAPYLVSLPSPMLSTRSLRTRSPVPTLCRPPSPPSAGSFSSSSKQSIGDIDNGFIPCSFLRGGTSKGIFIKASDLPLNKAKWDEIFLGLMGSPDSEYGRQLNGLGGGVSSLSKIVIVGKVGELTSHLNNLPASIQATALGCDVEYAFVQVGIRDNTVDYAGNCGNLSSVVGVFAAQEMLLQPRVVQSGPQLQTKKVISTTFPVNIQPRKHLDSDEAQSQQELLLELNREEVSIAGVPGLASRIWVDFENPSGAKTGQLLPSGQPMDNVVFPLGAGSTRKALVPASLVDATNPTVIVAKLDVEKVLGKPALDAFLASAFSAQAPPSDVLPSSSVDASEVLESIRRAGALLMGLDPKSPAQPKLCLISPSRQSEPDSHLFVQALSMGVPHKAIPMTIALCLGVAAKTKGTLVEKMLAGEVAVSALMNHDGKVSSARVIRTGKVLMKGQACWR
ncbi:PrpF protein-domain-containing protein [Flagelloscypha sp. PMI_526]|nr:PrpF protein-domain-containing protein [Flagelloscypha sp. PMI_526]